jgi:polysaccharide biosynthesis/export protein
MRFGFIRSHWDCGLNRSSLISVLLFCLASPCLAQQKPISQAGSQAQYLEAANAPAPVVSQKSPGATSNPVASEYVVGVSDILDIEVWKEPELSRPSVVIRPDGIISMPLIGEVQVDGMTPSQIQDVLAEKLHRYLNAARVTVSVAEIKSKFVYVTGEVNKPGAYLLAAPIDVLQLVIKAGGLTPFARSRSITILRFTDGKQEKLAVNYKKLLRGEYPEQNVFLLPGDTVVVP